MLFAVCSHWRAAAPVACALVIASTSRVSAQEVHAVVGEHGVDAARVEAVFNVLTERGREVVRFSRPAESVAGEREGARAVAEANAAVTRARADYVQVRLGSAIEQLERAEADHLVGLLSTAKGRAALVEMCSWLGNLLVASGKRDEAEARFGLALALSPGLEIDRATFPPEVTAVFDEVKQRGVGASGSLTIETRPPGADLEVDGRVARDRTPATITASAGWHYLLLRMPGFRDWAQRVRIEAGEVKALPVALGAADRDRVATDVAHVMTEIYPKDARRAVRLIAAAAGADKVVIVGAAEVKLYTAGGKTEASARGGDARAAAQSLFVDAVEQPRGEGRPLYAKWWFWTATGAAAVATGALIFALTREDTVRGRFLP